MTREEFEQYATEHNLVVWSKEQSEDTISNLRKHIDAIQNIRAEIQVKYDEIPYRYKDYEDGFIDGLEWVLSVIDKHIGKEKE